jgi:NAD+ kinase
VTKIERIAIVAHDRKPAAVALAAEIGAWLAERGIEQGTDDPQLVLALGGDGTVLRAAQLAHAQGAPLLGVNLGALGYLSEVDAGDELTALEKVLDGSYELEDRMMLACHIEVEGGGERDYVGLNEVLVERASRHRLVRLVARIGGEQLAAFNADGLIVATPTGSTAYALSAGGPIVSPRAQCLVLVPVSPHMIFSRPFVLAPDDEVEIVVDRESGQEASVSLDGAIGRDVPAGSVVTVRRHDRPLQLVRLTGPGFIERLRVKLGLPG